MKSEKQKIIIITYESIYSMPLVESLIKNRNYKVLTIILNKSLYSSKSLFQSVFYFLRKASILFLIAKFNELFLYRLFSILLPIAKRPFKTISEIEQIYGIDCNYTRDINTYFIKKTYKDTILFSIYYNQIINKETIDKFKKAYNIHPAPIPEGRGMFTQFWLLIDKSKSGQYYQTIHELTPKIDGGKVIIQMSDNAQQEKPSMFHYMNVVTLLGCKMLRTFNEKNKTQPYLSDIESYYSFPKTKDVIRFWKTGNRFFYWKDIENFLNSKQFLNK